MSHSITTARVLVYYTTLSPLWARLCSSVGVAMEGELPKGYTGCVTEALIEVASEMH